MKGMKGIALPIEVIVIVAICVLVLVVVAAIFARGAGKISYVEVERAFSALCSIQIAQCGTDLTKDLKAEAFDIDGDGKLDGPNGKTLLDLCKLKGVNDKPENCKTACGCPKTT